MSKKKTKNLPEFLPTPNDIEIQFEPIKHDSYYDLTSTQELEATTFRKKYQEEVNTMSKELNNLTEETVDIQYNPETKTFDKVFIQYSLSGKEGVVVRTEKGHTNPLVMQQEMSKYFLEKLVTKRKK